MAERDRLPRRHRRDIITVGGATDMIAAGTSGSPSLPDSRRADTATLFATVSGSFRRSMRGVQEAVFAFTDAGVRVLSPADPRVVAQLGDFLFVASDHLRA